MNRKSRIVAFTAVLTLAGFVLPAGPIEAAGRRGDGGTPQQGVSNSHQSGPVEAQAKNQADYHADYRVKGTQDEPAAKAIDDTRADSQSDRDRDRDRRSAPMLDRTLGRAPGAWGR